MSMEILPCSSIPPRRPVTPQTEYDRIYAAALNQEDLPKKKSKPHTSQPPKKKPSDIILTASPHFDLESAVENDELV